MHTQIVLYWLALASFLFAEAGKPNVLLILADDMGYGDVGVNGCKDIPTPHLDTLARSGVNFTAGYVTHPYCSPSRAAIMSGRYQARIGHDCNPQDSHKDASQGILPSAKLLPARLKKVGYRSALIGKWHLGHAEPYRPLKRGFDHFFGFLSGGYDYFGNPPRDKKDPIYDDERIVSPKEITYMTTDLGRAAIRFIEKSGDKPWFCFLSYSAPHAPDQAPKDVIAKFSHIEDKKRRVYAAMVSVLDDSIGEVVADLKKRGQLENTLVIFLSDNGGRRVSSNNGIYRGHKGRTYEGGVRVPFMISMPGKIASGKEVAQPVSSLDLYASIMALAGAKDSGAEGIDLLPHLGATQASWPERSLFYRISGGWGYSVSEPKYKLVKPGWKEQAELYDLEVDPSEKTDVADRFPKTVSRLSQKYEEWNKTNIAPLWSDPHKANVAREMRDDEAK